LSTAVTDSLTGLRSDPWTREDLTIEAPGASLAAWLYRPAGSGPFPVVIMSHGFGALKEMSLDRTAEIFAGGGYAVIVYDHRNLGRSTGEPRQHISAWDQVHDMRDVVTRALSLDCVDPARVALWGTSFSGGVAIIAGAVDRRVAAVIAQAPFVSGSATLDRMVPAAAQHQLFEAFRAERSRLQGGGEPTLIPISKPGEESYAWTSVAGVDCGYVNNVTLLTQELVLEFEPIDFIHRVSPRPLLMIVARADTRTPTDLQLEAFARAREPKQIVFYEGGHYAPYLERLEETADHALRFLQAQL
jgi:fermentation-respiration switch protein FrsA (DUF1100 family)